MAGYMPGKRGWIKRRTRKTFLTAAASLLNEKEYYDVSVIDICDRAGIPRATFYNYFEDKYDLMRSAAAELVERIEGYKGEENASDLEYLSGLIDLVLHYHKSQCEFLPVFYKVEGAVPGAVAKALSDKLVVRLQDRFLSDVLAAEVAYGAKWWTETGCVTEPEYMKKRLLDAAGYRA